jgi:uncharacterized membrane protein YjfL (UPF0719 family)
MEFFLMLRKLLPIARWLAVFALISPALFFHDSMSPWSESELLCLALACVIAFSNKILTLITFWKSGRDARRRVIKIAAWGALAIVLIVACAPLIVFGIFEVASFVADLCCERQSDAWQAVHFGISFGTIPGVVLVYVIISLFVQARRHLS